MTDARTPASGGGISLVARRLIRAPVQRVFAAWTEPERLKLWWGPEAVTCPEAEVDLRVGGAYRLANLLPDGRVIWVSGEFLEVEPPRKLVYTWLVGDPSAAAERTRVTVRFEPRESATEVIVVHELIASEGFRDRTSSGWDGCLASLAEYFENSAAST
jgi:uncharacterized protein YndB with AHSA1/START domain